MSATLNINEDAALSILRLYILSRLPGTIEVVRGMDNRVSEPLGDYVILTIMSRVRLSTNILSFIDIPRAGMRNSLQPTQLTVQVDVHGPSSANNAQIITTLIRDGDACAVMNGTGMQALFANDANRLPFINGEGQYEDRWTIDVVLQLNAVVGLPQDFADKITIKPVPVDAVGSLTDVSPVGSASMVQQSANKATIYSRNIT